MSERTGFFEESPGVRSMTRLTIAWLMLLASALVATACWYVVEGPPEHKVEVLGGIGAILLTITVKAVVAIRNRNGGAAAKEDA
jgi:hypothetical protein